MVLEAISFSMIFSSLSLVEKCWLVDWSVWLPKKTGARELTTFSKTRLFFSVDRD
jgi:hypothetical protein